jgi:hypothetical protein
MGDYMAGLLIVLAVVGLFVGYVLLMAVGAKSDNKDYAAERPDDPFSRGMDAAWKGDGPPPSKQDRSEHIRLQIKASRWIPDGRPASARLELEARMNKSADEVAARAKVYAAEARQNSEDKDK